MKHGRKAVAALFLLLSIGMFASCGAEDTAADGQTESAVAETEDITVSGVDLSGYTLVVPRKSDDAESDTMMILYKNPKYPA